MRDWGGLSLEIQTGLGGGVVILARFFVIFKGVGFVGGG
jgi:hypothetical protein